MEENEYFKRANFFPGLKATPGFWNEMEEYHFRKETLFNNLFHGTGIVPDYRQSLHVLEDLVQRFTLFGKDRTQMRKVPYFSTSPESEDSGLVENATL